MAKVSYRRQRILAFIESFIRERGYPPTVREIQKACSISSTSVVNYNLEVLKEHGYIRRDPEVSRGIEVKKRDTGDLTGLIPVMGYIAAGEPLLVPGTEGWLDVEPLETLEVPRQLMKGRTTLYALRVKGISMIDALIDDGDIVIMEPAEEIKDGDMVAAWLLIEKEATLKRIYREGEKIRLQPANRDMRPIYAVPSNVEIQGKVVAVLRQMA